MLTISCFRFGPSPDWKLDRLIQVMSIESRFVADSVASDMIALITVTSSLQEVSVRKLYVAMIENTNQDRLVQVAAWAIGEFGDQYINTESGVRQCSWEIVDAPWMHYCQCNSFFFLFLPEGNRLCFSMHISLFFSLFSVSFCFSFSLILIFDSLYGIRSLQPTLSLIFSLVFAVRFPTLRRRNDMF